MLLEEGADPTARDDSGQSAYQIATFYKQHHLSHRFAPDSPSHRFGI